VPRFLRHSTKEFDYLDLVRPPVANPLPSQIEELIRDELFTMYRSSAAAVATDASDFRR
jgi:hypothetical protein